MLTALLAVVCLAAGCGRPTAREAPLRPDQVRDFATLYGQNCAGCHGAEGKLGPAPPLADPLFLAIVSDDQLRQAICDGRHGTMMPSFAGERSHLLVAEQVEVLIAGIRSAWGAAVSDAEGAPPYALPANLADQAVVPESGPLFARHCGSCHGADGRGGDGGALREPAFLALMSDQALRRIIITGRPDLGMPNWRRRAAIVSESTPLTSAEIDQLVALMAHWRREPAAPEQAAVAQTRTAVAPTHGTVD